MRGYEKPNLGIALVNTVQFDGDEWIDTIDSFEDFVAWTDEANFGAIRPMPWDEDDHHDIRMVRDATREVLQSIHGEAPINPAAVAFLDEAASMAELIRRVGLVGDEPRTWWEHIGPPGAVALAHVANEGIELIAGVARESVAPCAAADCGNFFLRQHGRQKYCEPSCSARARQSRRRDN